MMYRSFFSYKKSLAVYKIISLVFLFNFLWLKDLAQCPSKENLSAELIIINKDPALSVIQKLKGIYGLKKLFEQCNLYRDSIYAGILHKIGFYEFETKNYQAAIDNTLEAVRINTSGKKG